MQLKLWPRCSHHDLFRANFQVAIIDIGIDFPSPPLCGMHVNIGHFRGPVQISTHSVPDCVRGNRMVRDLSMKHSPGILHKSIRSIILTLDKSPMFAIDPISATSWGVGVYDTS